MSTNKVYLATGPWLGSTKYAQRTVLMVAPLKPNEVVVTTQTVQNVDSGQIDCSTGSGTYYCEATHGKGFLVTALQRHAALVNEGFSDDMHPAPPIVARIANALFA